MKCRKQLVLTGYRIQFVDLREPKPRTPRKLTHVVDSAWLEAVGLLGQSPIGNITEMYEKGGYKVFSVQPIRPKRVVELDLCQLWTEAAPPATEEAPASPDSEVCPE